MKLKSLCFIFTISKDGKTISVEHGERFYVILSNLQDVWQWADWKGLTRSLSNYPWIWRVKE